MQLFAPSEYFEEKYNKEGDNISFFSFTSKQGNLDNKYYMDYNEDKVVKITDKDSNNISIKYEDNKIKSFICNLNNEKYEYVYSYDGIGRPTELRRRSLNSELYNAYKTYTYYIKNNKEFVKIDEYSEEVPNSPHIERGKFVHIGYKIYLEEDRIKPKTIFEILGSTPRAYFKYNILDPKRIEDRKNIWDFNFINNLYLYKKPIKVVENSLTSQGDIKDTKITTYLYDKKGRLLGRKKKGDSINVYNRDRQAIEARTINNGLYIEYMYEDISDTETIVYQLFDVDDGTIAALRLKNYEKYSEYITKIYYDNSNNIDKIEDREKPVYLSYLEYEKKQDEFMKYYNENIDSILVDCE